MAVNHLIFNTYDRKNLANDFLWNGELERTFFDHAFANPNSF
jgi:hypothetical protein